MLLIMWIGCGIYWVWIVLIVMLKRRWGINYTLINRGKIAWYKEQGESGLIVSVLHLYICGFVCKWLWVILLKTGQNCDIEGKIQSVNFLMLLFGNESLTSLVYLNWQGDRNLVNCALCYVIGQCLACYRRHQKCMNRVGSVASLTLAYFIIQYFLIDKGISVTSDIK